MIARVIVSRAKVYPCVARRGPAWRWMYSYSIDGAAAMDYGTGLPSLRRMLRDKHSITPADITTDWQVRS